LVPVFSQPARDRVEWEGPTLVGPQGASPRRGFAVMDLLRDIHRNGATICMVPTTPATPTTPNAQSSSLFDGKIAEVTQPASSSSLRVLRQLLIEWPRHN